VIILVEQDEDVKSEFKRCFKQFPLAEYKEKYNELLQYGNELTQLAQKVHLPKEKMKKWGQIFAFHIIVDIGGGMSIIAIWRVR